MIPYRSASFGLDIKEFCAMKPLPGTGFTGISLSVIKQFFLLFPVFKKPVRQPPQTQSHLLCLQATKPNNYEETCTLVFFTTAMPFCRRTITNL